MQHFRPSFLKIYSLLGGLQICLSAFPSLAETTVEDTDETVMTSQKASSCAISSDAPEGGSSCSIAAFYGGTSSEVPAMPT
jgi:hypothetical protein